MSRKILYETSAGERFWKDRALLNTLLLGDCPKTAVFIEKGGDTYAAVQMDLGDGRIELYSYLDVVEGIKSFFQADILPSGSDKKGEMEALLQEMRQAISEKNEPVYDYFSWALKRLNPNLLEKFGHLLNTLIKEGKGYSP